MNENKTPEEIAAEEVAKAEEIRLADEKAKLESEAKANQEADYKVEPASSNALFSETLQPSKDGESEAKKAYREILNKYAICYPLQASERIEELTRLLSELE